MKTRILFIQQISWNWIKQRPHFFAEGLSDIGYSVRVLHPGKIKSSNQDLRVTPELQISESNYSLNRIARFFQLFWLARKVDIVWFNHPRDWLLFSKLPAIFRRGKTLVYDCMDDHAHFFDSPQEVNNVLNLEQRFIQHMDLVFFSSKALQQSWKQRGFNGKNLVINNAFSPRWVFPEKCTQSIGKTIKLSYVGVISKWFDISLILAALKKYTNIEVNLYGPVEIGIPEHSRLIVHGKIPHHLVQEILNEADILIMPFVLNKLIYGVDPVKAYEYIASGKPVILKKYPETEKFAPLAKLYKTLSDFCQILDEYLCGNLQSNESEIIDFRNKNNWNQRVQIVKLELKKALIK